MTLLFGGGFYAGEGGLVAAPTIVSSILVPKSGASDPQSISTIGPPALSWAAGQRVLSFAAAASVNISNIAGATDDTDTLIADITANQSRLHMHEINVAGGALDASLSYDLTGSRQIIASLLTISSDLDTITTPSENSGAAGTSLPVSSSIDVGATVKNRLILAVASVRGAHVTNPLVEPSGFTPIQIGATTTNNPSSTLHHTIGIAYLAAPASSGVISAATWQGAADAVTNNQLWAAFLLALEPA